jgi:hypothetical protein
MLIKYQPRKMVTLCLTFIAWLAIMVSASNQLACEGQQINYNTYPGNEEQIWGDFVVGQSFVATHDNLDRVDIVFHTYWRTNTKEIIFRLLETPEATSFSDEATELFWTTFNASTVSNLSWRTFTFPNIPDSMGKTYLVTIQSPDSVSGDAITVGGIDFDIYPHGMTFISSVPVPTRDITFRVCYNMTISEKLQLLTQQITDNRPSVWGNSGFYQVIFVIYFLLLVIFLWQLVSLD